MILTDNQRAVLSLLAAAPLDHYRSGWTADTGRTYIHPRIIASLATLGLLRITEPRPRHLVAKITQEGRLLLAPAAKLLESA